MTYPFYISCILTFGCPLPHQISLRIDHVKVSNANVLSLSCRVMELPMGRAASHTKGTQRSYRMLLEYVGIWCIKIIKTRCLDSQRLAAQSSKFCPKFQFWQWVVDKSLDAVIGYSYKCYHMRTHSISELDAKRSQTYLIVVDTKVTLILLYSTYYWVCQGWILDTICPIKLCILPHPFLSRILLDTMLDTI